MRPKGSCCLSHLRVLDESARNANFVAEQTKATYMAVFEDDAWCTVAPDTVVKVVKVHAAPY